MNFAVATRERSSSVGWNSAVENACAEDIIIVRTQKRWINRRVKVKVVIE
jgi:hypothetical protein